MKRFVCVVYLGVFSLGCLGLSAQQASEEQMNEALEILRKSYGQRPAPSSQTPPTAAAPDQSQPKASSPNVATKPAARQLSPEEERQALEILRGIETARPTSAPTPQATTQVPSEKDIQAALDEAKRDASQPKAGAAPVSQDTLSEELSLVESEIIKSKQGSQAGTSDQSSKQPTPSSETTSAASPKTALQPMTAEQEKQALDLLRALSREIMQENTTPAITAADETTADVKMPDSTAAAPATSAMSSRDRSMADLLQAYRNDEITAAEYHRERARLLQK